MNSQRIARMREAIKPKRYPTPPLTWGEVHAELNRIARVLVEARDDAEQKAWEKFFAERSQ